MEVKINVDEAMFKDILENELKALPKEKIQEALVESIKEYFRSCDYDAIKKLLIIEKPYYSRYDCDKPSPFAKNLIESADLSGLQDVIDKCIETLKTNYEEILKKVILESIISGFTNSGTFQNAVELAITAEINKLENRLHNN